MLREWDFAKKCNAISHAFSASLASLAWESFKFILITRGRISGGCVRRRSYSCLTLLHDKPRDLFVWDDGAAYRIPTSTRNIAFLRNRFISPPIIVVCNLFFFYFLALNRQINFHSSPTRYMYSESIIYHRISLSWFHSSHSFLVLVGTAWQFIIIYI